MFNKSRVLWSNDPRVLTLSAALTGASVAMDLTIVPAGHGDRRCKRLFSKVSQ